MSSGAAADGYAPRVPAGDVDLEAQVRALLEEVAGLRRLADDTEHRVRVLEAELREARWSRGDSDGSTGWGPRFAAIYADYTDRFRGSTAEIRAKLEGYLPDVRRLAGTGGVVDIGAGRGEWLELLRDVGVRASGVDTNSAFVAAGRARGLDIELGDGLRKLHRLPPDSVDMVTAFHLIEHLDTEEVLALLEAARAALRPGGCVLLETPNPANLVTGACDFYNDPTHRSPLPSALMDYLLSAQGFEDVEVRPLHPKPSPLAIYGGQEDAALARLREIVSQVLFGPQDYAVLGYKPRSG